MVLFAERRPLLVAGLAFTLGVWLAFHAGVQTALPLLLACLALLGVGAALSRWAPGTAVLALFLGFGFAGASSAALKAHTVGAPLPEAVETIEGEVASPPVLLEGRTRLLVHVFSRLRAGRWEPVRYDAQVSIGRPVAALPGDRVRLAARLRPPAPALNPGAPDRAERAARVGLAAVGSVVEDQLVLFGESSASARAVAGFRTGFARVAQAAIDEPQTAALVRALAVGDRAELAEEVNEDFNASGLAHVLSVSGLHVAVVAAGLYALLRWLLGRSERLLLTLDVRALASAGAIAATWLYVAVSGAEPPAVRSGLMASALFLSRVVGRDPDALTSLAAALLAALLYDPASLESLSFQLSFAAVAGLVVLTRPLRRLLPVPPPAPGVRPSRGRALLEGALAAAAGSLAASLATAPLVAAAFHRASLVAVAANAVALPVASGLTVVSALAAAAFGLSEALAGLFLCFAAPLARLLLGLSHLFGALPFASVAVPAPSLPVTLAWYAALAALALLPVRRRLALKLGLPALAVLAVALAGQTVLPRLSRATTVTFLAVGQGDCALVTLPGGRHLLVDGGGDPNGFDVGKRVLLPTLVQLGVRRLDAVVLSHPHPDHALGLFEVLRALPVRELWVGPPTEEPQLRDALVELARARRVAVRVVGPGDRFEFGAARLEVLAHPQGFQGLSANDASLVLRLRVGAEPERGRPAGPGVSFLFAGDIEEATEQALAAQSELRADVLKVPHHGSETSSSPALLGAVRPAHAVFSVGLRNRFRFPRPAVLARYEGAGCRIHRTDLDGAVTFRTDGERLEVEHFRGRVEAAH